MIVVANTAQHTEDVTSVKGQRVKVTQGVSYEEAIQKVPETLNVTGQNKTTTSESKNLKGIIS